VLGIRHQHRHQIHRIKSKKGALTVELYSLRWTRVRCHFEPREPSFRHCASKSSPTLIFIVRMNTVFFRSNSFAHVLLTRPRSLKSIYVYSVWEQQHTKSCVCCRFVSPAFIGPQSRRYPFNNVKRFVSFQACSFVLLANAAPSLSIYI